MMLFVIAAGTLMYGVFAAVAAAIIVGIIVTAKRNNAIKTAGIETEAVVSRVVEEEMTDEDGHRTGTTYTNYVTYRTMSGETVEAKLASGKSLDTHIGKAWDSDLKEGSTVLIKYLPEKPKYVIRL